MEQDLLYRQQFQETLSTLNEHQRESVLSKAKTLQILAGPGSGKTRVLTCRAAHLVLNENTKPQQVIVVTFTNKAANEMKKRLYSMIGNKNTDNLVIGTFHSICSRILRHNAAVVDLKSNFTIADKEVSQDIIKKLQKDEKLDIDSFTRTRQKPGVISNIISKAKSEGITASQYKEMYSEDFAKRNIAVLYEAYEQELYNNNLVDFDNILIKACELFRRKRDVLAHIKAVLVDEYQDTNVVQYDLIKLITKNQHTDKTVTIVGDPDQSIFGWRSAEPKNFNKMQDDYLDTQSINMEQNYRSTKAILDAALHVIKQDVTRIDKSLYTNNPVGIPISILSTRNEDTQAEFVAKEIKKVIKYSKGLVSFKDFAVLMRSNFTSRKFEATFRKLRIPFSIICGDRFFDRIEIKDMLAYLAFSYNNFDYQSYSRIINVPKRGIGEVTIKKIAVLHETHPNESMLETLHAIGRNRGAFNNAIRLKIRGLAMICEDVKTMIEQKIEISEILEFIITATEYKEYLKDKYFQDHEARYNNLGELISLSKEEHHVGDDDPIISQSQTQQGQNANHNSLDVVDAEVVAEDEDEDNEANESEEVPHFTADEGIPDFTMDEEVDLVDISEQQPKDSFNLPQNTGHDGSSAGPRASNDTEIPNKDGEEYDIPVKEKDYIVQFLEYCSMSAHQKEQEEAEGGKVTISTIHSAKGLEWPCVFIATCNEGSIPSQLSSDVSEEGRLLYVAMTRSQFFLYCMCPEERNSWGEYRVETRTRFFDNMNRKHRQAIPPEWDNDTRSMLAATLDKPAPPDDDELVTKKDKGKQSGYSTQYADSQSQGFYSQSQGPQSQSQPSSSSSSSQHSAKYRGGFVSASTLTDQRPLKRAKPKHTAPNKFKEEANVKAEPIDRAIVKREVKVKSEPLD
ncbi:P-loop containing nucleoside triphosphate hydrolase protein [Parasitella parasitica]|nr:P-loop containing nucleoside triphosphate hydrolase protein [Parasitella parasitica]